MFVELYISVKDLIQIHYYFHNGDDNKIVQTRAKIVDKRIGGE